MPEQRYFKKCTEEKYMVIDNDDEVNELLEDWSWYEIPAWDYECRNRKFAHRVHITPRPAPQPEGIESGLSDDDYPNEGTGYFDIA